MSARKRTLGGIMATLVCVATAVVSPAWSMQQRVAHAATTQTVTWLVRTDPVINPWERATVKAFEKLHPNIQVELVLTPPSAAYDQKLLTMVASGDPPSIFSHWGNDSWADLVYRGVAADLTPYIQTSHFSLDGMDSASLKEYSIGGHVYGIPFASGGSYLFYNADLFRKAHLALPPTNWNDRSWTWAALLKDAQALTKNVSNVAKATYGLYDNLWPENANAWLFGGDIFPANSYKTGVVSTVNATSAAVKQSVQWQWDIIHKYKVALSPSVATALSGSNDPFLTGRVGMELTGIWGFWVYVPAKFKWGVAAIPYFKSDKDVIFTDPWMMAKKAKNPQAAWTFLEYLSSPQYGDKTYVETSGVYPPWKQLGSDWAKMMAQRTILKPEQLLQLGAGSMAHGQESINHLAINYGEFDTTITNVLQPVWTGSTTPQQAVQNMQTQLTEDIKKANVSPGGYASHH